MKKGAIITASILIVIGIALVIGAVISSGSDLNLQKFTEDRAVFKGEAADFSKIRILNAWGGLRDSGLYSEICDICNI